MRKVWVVGSGCHRHFGCASITSVLVIFSLTLSSDVGAFPEVLVPFVAVVHVVSGFVQGRDFVVLHVGDVAGPVFISHFEKLSGVEPEWGGVGGKPIMDV